MVNYNSPHLDSTFAALADPTRRAIVQRLATGGSTVKELARPFHMSLPAISKHLRILEQAGLLQRQKLGRVHHCHLNPIPLGEVKNWLTWYQQFWEHRLDSLEQYLHSSHPQPITKEQQPWPISQKPVKPPSKLRGRLKPAEKRSSKRGQTPKS